jgi:hypothetical protein
VFVSVSIFKPYQLDYFRVLITKDVKGYRYLTVWNIGAAKLAEFLTPLEGIPIKRFSDV